jgi:hypothetical protein
VRVEGPHAPAMVAAALSGIVSRQVACTSECSSVGVYPARRRYLMAVGLQGGIFAKDSRPLWHALT